MCSLFFELLTININASPEHSGMFVWVLCVFMSSVPLPKSPSILSLSWRSYPYPYLHFGTNLLFLWLNFFSEPPSDCTYERRPYRHSERFYHPTDSCQSCVCTNGTVHCQRKPCPFASCTHPISRECCRSCEGRPQLHQKILTLLCCDSLSCCLVGCLVNGQERANGETWEDPSDRCAVCMCRQGSVHCEKKRCPPFNCKHPIQRECCMSCDGDWPKKKNVISMLLCQRSIFLMLSLLFILQAACSTERNILMALSLLMTKTPVACVTAMEVKLSAPKYLVTENAATLTNHPHSAVENVTVCASPRGIIFLVTRVIKW